MRPAAALLAGLLLALAPSCGSRTGTAKSDAAQAAFTAGKYAEARKLCDEGLAMDDVKKDKAIAWKLERIRIESMASSGDKGAEVVPTLARLSTEYAQQIDAQYYAKLASELNVGGNLLEAIDVVGAGKARFPAKAKEFDAVVDQLKKAAEGNDAASQKLKQLGYL